MNDVRQKNTYFSFLHCLTSFTILRRVSNLNLIIHYPFKYKMIEIIYAKALIGPYTNSLTSFIDVLNTRITKQNLNF